MTTWDQFFPFIATEVEGCPNPVVEHHLKMTVRDFCQRSHAWREWIDANVMPGTTNRFEYDLTSSQELVKVSRALLNDKDLAIKAGGALPADWQTGTSTENYAQQTLVHFDNSEFMVFPIPADGDVLTLEIVFRPKLSATSVGDVLYNEYVDTISAGCKSRIMRMPRQKWTDLQMAGFYASMFEKGIHSAANIALLRTGSSAMRVTKAPL